MPRARAPVWMTVVVVGTAACSGSGSSPAAPDSATLTVVLTAGTDYGTVAIKNVSTVVFSTPWTVPDATYAIDFGDGQSGRMSPGLHSIQNARAEHTYASTGTFTAGVTIVDASGSRALGKGSATMTVRDVSGRWVSAQVNGATNRLETRTFQLVQTGSALSGSYTRPDGLVQSIGGRLSSPRSINLMVDGQTIAYGTDLDRAGISEDVNAFTVLFQPLERATPMTFVRQ